MSYNYNPQPPRVWSRVQNECSTINDSNNNRDNSNNILPYEIAKQMLLKGNVLQYKKNSSNLTKNQRYSKIAKGQWTNRTKTWATQSQTYSNPNTSSLLRVNYSQLPIPFNAILPLDCSSNFIKDGGNLICNIVVDPCTDTVIKTTNNVRCYSTSDSDVPGPIQELCWDDRVQTWYPRQNLTMNNSANKWPEGYKGFVSAVSPGAPYLMFDISGNIANLSWKIVLNNCLPVNSFNIYENDRLIANVPFPNTSTNIVLNYPSSIFYVTSLSGITESGPSNTVIIIPQITPPVLSASNITTNTAKLSWTVYNSYISSFNIYNYSTNVLLYTVPYPTTSTNVLLNGPSSIFVVVAVNSASQSGPSNTVTVNALITPPVLSASNITTNTATLSWTVDNSYITSFNIYNYSTNALLYTVPYPTTSTNVALNGPSSIFVVVDVNSATQSGPSNTVTVNALITPPVLSASNITTNTATLSWTVDNSYISSFNIYNYSTNALLYTVPYPTTSTNVALNDQSSIFVVVAVNSASQSTPSNTVTVNAVITPPVLSASNITTNTATLSWTVDNSIITSFNIYENGTVIANVPYSTTMYNVSIGYGNNYFYVVAVNSATQSTPSNTVNVYNPSSFSLTGNGSSYNYNSSTGVYTVTFSSSGTISFLGCYEPITCILVGGGGGGAGGHGNNTTIVTGGAGGGGGQTNFFTTTSYTNNVIYSIVVGNGGQGSNPSKSSSGGQTSSIYFDTTYNALGGQGAQYGTSGTSNGLNGVNSGSLFGGGGPGGGQSSGQVMTSIYSGGNEVAGGGGGGIAFNLTTMQITTAYGGNAGNGGNGGIGGTNYGGNGGNSNGSNGQSATGIGGGGGGGSGAQSYNSSTYYYEAGSGGNGGNGICILQFNLTYPPN